MVPQTKNTTISLGTYQSLRSSILEGKLLPGTKLRIGHLCDQFGANLGAVREALSKLTAEGLVIAQAHRAYLVAPISVDDLQDLSRIRIEIETTCLRWSIQRGRVEWEARLVAAAHSLSKMYLESGDEAMVPALAQAHSDYHLALVSACGSPRLLRFRSQLYEQSERYRRLELALPRDRSPNAEHSRITEAALSRDVELATRLLSEHIARTTENIARGMASAASG